MAKQKLSASMGFDATEIKAGVEAAKKAFNELGTNMRGKTKSINNLNKAFEKLMTSANKGARGVRLLGTALKYTTQNLEAFNAQLRQSNTLLLTFSRRVNPTQAQAYANAQARATAATRQSTRAHKQNTNAKQAATAATKQATQATQQATTAMQHHQQQVHLVGLTWQSMLRLLVVQIIHRAISSLVSGIREGVQAALDLEKAISEIQTIDTDRLPFAVWIDQLRELSDAWGIGIMDEAEAAYQALSNQLVDGADAARLMGEASRFAVTAVTDVNTAILAGSGALNAYGESADQAEDLFAKMFKTIELGRVRASELTSIGDVAILGKQAGLSLEEVFASLATLTVQGIKANKAMTQLRGIFVKLIKPTEEGARFFEKLGFESGSAAVKTLGFGKVLQELETFTGGTSENLAKIISRIRGISGAAALQGEGLARYGQVFEQITESAESYGTATKAVMENTGKTLQIEFNKIANFFKKEFGSDLIRRVADLTGGFKGLADAIILVTKVITIGLISAVSGLIALLLTFPAAWFIVAIGTIVGALGKMAERMREAAEIPLAEELQVQIENIDREIKAVEARYQKTKNALDKELREYRLQARERYKINRRLVLHYDLTNEAISESFRTTQRDVLKIVRRTVSGIESEINGLQKALEKFKEDSDFISEAFKEINFNFQFEIATPDQKIRLAKQKIEGLLETARTVASNATDKSDLSKLTDIEKDIVKAYQQMVKVQQDFFGKRSLDLQEQQNIAKETASIREMAENKILDSLRKQTAELIRQRKIVHDFEMAYTKVGDLDDVIKEIRGAKAPEELSVIFDRFVKNTNKLASTYGQFGLQDELEELWAAQERFMDEYFAQRDKLTISSEVKAKEDQIEENQRAAKRAAEAEKERQKDLQQVAKDFKNFRDELQSAIYDYKFKGYLPDTAGLSSDKATQLMQNISAWITSQSAGIPSSPEQMNRISAQANKLVDVYDALFKEGSFDTGRGFKAETYDFLRTIALAGKISQPSREVVRRQEIGTDLGVGGVAINEVNITVKDSGSPQVTALRPKGRFKIEHLRWTGIFGYRLLKTFEFPNDVVDEGITDLWDVYFRNQSQTAAWYIGLIDNAGSPSLSDSDTLASHAGWTEFTSYSGSRQQWVMDAAASKQITNTTLTQFTMSGSGTVYGLFVCGAASGTSAILWSTAPFASAQPVNNGDVLKVTYTVSGAHA
jgi:TP901 family phage tail tape measure protein